MLSHQYVFDGSLCSARNKQSGCSSEDLENDPFLNSPLQRATCELYYRFGSFLASLSIGIITSRHYIYEHNKNGERTSGTIATGGAEAPAIGGEERTAE